jgi:hypothetical protein
MVISSSFKDPVAEAGANCNGHVAGSPWQPVVFRVSRPLLQAIEGMVAKIKEILAFKLISRNGAMSNDFSSVFH